MSRAMIFLALVGLAVPASGLAQVKSAMSTAATMPAPPTAEYLKKAGQSDAFEIQSGRLAAKMGANAELKKFGAQMATDHTKSTEMVVAAAKKSGMSPTPPPLTPEQNAMLGELKAKSGPAFDQAYMKQQMAAHQDALKLQSGYAAGGADANLKATAAKIVPVVKMHIEMLQKMPGA